MKKKYFFAMLSLTCFILLVGISCGKSSDSTYTPPPPGGSTTATVNIYNMTFTPSTKTVAKGTVVKWTNNDGYLHTVTSNDGSTFNSGNISSGGTYSYTTITAGTFDYHCNIHGLGMSGTLIVTP